MKKTAGILSILAFSLVSFTPVAELPIGSPLPKADQKMKDVSGREISFKDAQRKNGLLVMFSCNTCPYVVKNQQRTKDVCGYAQKNEIGVVLVNSNEALRSDEESLEAMQQYAKAQGYSWYYVVDKNNAMADAFGASRTPESYLFDKDGKLIYTGAIDNSPDEDAVTRKHLHTAIDEMLSGKEVTVKTSRSIGCGIKRLK